MGRINWFRVIPAGQKNDMPLKKCPTCARTYVDESISFCLADGALLSAPCEDETIDRPVARSAIPPPTELLSPESIYPLRPTQAAGEVVPPMPTLTSQIPPQVFARTAQNRSPVETEADGAPGRPRWFSYVLLFVAAFVADLMTEVLASAFWSNSLYLTVIPIVFGLGAIFIGLAWPRVGWKVGLWLIAAPCLRDFIILVRGFNFISVPIVWRHAVDVIWLSIAASIGSYFGSRLVTKSK